jgi:hypothetical protein
MGSGSKKKHAVSTVVPASVSGVAGTGTLGPSYGTGIGGGLSIGTMSASGFEAAEAAHAAAEQFASQTFPPTIEGYKDLLEQLELSKGIILNAEEHGAGQFTSDDWTILKDACTGYVNGLSTEQIEAIAAAEGFQHPGLMGLSVGKATHPLSFWLNPYYDDASAKKDFLQQKALARFAGLQAGVADPKVPYTLQSYLAKYPHALDNAAPTPPKLVLSPEEIDALKVQIATTAAELKAIQYTHQPANVEKRANLRLDLLEMRSKFAQAESSDPAYDKGTIDVSDQMVMFHSGDVAQVYGRLQADHGLTPVQAELLGGTQLGWYIGGTAEQHLKAKDHLAASEATHAEMMGYWPHVQKAYLPLLTGTAETSDLALGLPTLLPGKNMDEVQDFLHSVKPHYDAVNALGPSFKASQAFKHELDPDGSLGVAHPGMVAYGAQPANFRAWAKQQPMAQLRALAVKEGAGSAAEVKKLTRAQVQNYLIGTYDVSAKLAYNNSIAKAASAPTPSAVKVVGAAPNGAASAATSAGVAASKPSSSPKPSGAGMKLPGTSNFGAKQAAMAQGLQSLAAALNAMPDRPSKEEVAGLKLTETSAPVSGGAHSKAFYKDEKGRVWMFKPDNSGGGARATAEAAASELFHRVGLPSVPVYSRKVGSHKKGSLQPIVNGTKNLESSPTSWSQADVDSMVRYHVASWMAGDHDGNSTNVLRTAGGGVVAVDLGQAWKFVGRDKLDVDYHPNSSFGSVPVYHQAYKASQSGALATGVKVRPEAALPVIQAFEHMPDAEFRELVRPYAEEGVKADLPWKGPMAKVAKTKYSTTAPSEAQIVESFLETVVARKQTLRKDFMTFFAGMGFEGSTTLEAVA